MEVLSRQKQEKDIISELEQGSSSRYIISIVGMPGIGKTSLAKKVYHDPNVAAHFRWRAWCSVSQIYGKRNILLEISKEIDELDVLGDLEQNLFQLLKRCRCLIILDDLWDVEALNGLSTQFDDNREGSKILITTRFHRMALEARPSGHYPFSLHPLQEEESWDLLKMKLFRGEGSIGSCPNELVEIGKKIARACRGLPLSVVAIAGILERTEKTVDCWNKIAQNLNSSIIDDPQSQCKGIIELSYMFLPLHLRECFLYLGAFLEGRDVSASKLIRLWIVEGFIEKSDPEKSLEDTAEGYLMDLIDRSLVMISRTKFNGMVKSCSIHDLLREFCLLKAKAGKFFQLVTMHDQPYAKYNGVDYGDELIEHCKSNPVFYEGCRVLVQIKGKHFFDSSPSGQCTHTLMLLPTSDSAHYDISLIPERFRLLTVLNLERISISSGFPRDIEVLVFLRYLAVSGNVNSIPESIGKLWRLETFIVRGTSDKIVIPSSIWGLVKPRHLHVKNCATLNPEDSLSVSDYVLHDLVSFSSPALLGDLENIPSRVPNLRKLSCIFLKSSTQFPELESLTRLESLRIMYSGSAPTYSDFNLPKSFKKLTLSNFGLPWQQIDTIARLPNLQVLELVCGAFKGEKWDMVEDKFPKLEFLMLDSLNFSQWVGPYDNLTELKKLVVKNCKELEKIPCDFSYSDSLETIEVHNCKESVKLSAKRIGEKFDARVITSEM